jgi:hypothetical protein
MRFLSAFMFSLMQTIVSTVSPPSWLFIALCAIPFYTLSHVLHLHTSVATYAFIPCMGVGLYSLYGIPEFIKQWNPQIQHEFPL